MARIKPDENHCKKCGEPVRYATLMTGGRNGLGVAFDAKQEAGAGFFLSEQEIDGVATGRWEARYVKVDDRTPGVKAFRQHDCKPWPLFDNRDMAPVLIQGVWHLVSRVSMRGVPQ